MNLEFIKDEALRQRTEDSIEYLYTLYEESKGDDKNDLYRTETYRVIILYTVSIIEALLFYIYERKGVVIMKIEHKERITLPNSYKNKTVGGKICVLVEKTTEKTESEISLRELVNFLEKKKVLKKATVKKLLNLIQTRNSVHLRQKSETICNIQSVEKALDLLAYVLIQAPRHLK